VISKFRTDDNGQQLDTFVKITVRPRIIVNLIIFKNFLVAKTVSTQTLELMATFILRIAIPSSTVLQ
jgi:hypothetical protein